MSQIFNNYNILVEQGCATIKKTQTFLKYGEFDHILGFLDVWN
jgi:hypothetical protein